MSRRAIMENFQEFRNLRNPEGNNRFGRATKAIFAIFVLVAMILAIFAVVKSDKLSNDHDAFVAEIQGRTRETEGYKPPSESLNPLEAARFEANLTQVNRLVQLLIKVATVPDRQKKLARVPRSKVFTALNNSETFSCYTGGQPLSSCLWARTINGQREVIVIDDQSVQVGGRTSAKGILYVGAGLADGKCTIRIEPVEDHDIGDWSCTLFSEGGAIFSGVVSITTKEPTFSIYFATLGGGLKAYSFETSSVRQVGSNGEIILGVAFDSVNDKIYWCSGTKIYRSNQDGTELKTDSSSYSGLQGLTFDWVTGNLYVVASGGNITACDTSLARPFTCATVVTGQGDVEGLALNPPEGTMYYTRFTPSRSIVKAGMDGSNPVVVVSGLSDAYGIAIDYETSRLYWADHGRKKIQSSNLKGGYTRDDVLFSANGPFGIALFNDTMIWGNDGTCLLQQRGKEVGAVARTLYTGTFTIRHLAVVPPYNLPTNRTNHCAGHNCSKICVLTASSFRCVN